LQLLAIRSKILIALSSLVLTFEAAHGLGTARPALEQEGEIHCDSQWDLQASHVAATFGLLWWTVIVIGEARRIVFAESAPSIRLLLSPALRS